MRRQIELAAKHVELIFVLRTLALVIILSIPASAAEIIFGTEEIEIVRRPVVVATTDTTKRREQYSSVTDWIARTSQRRRLKSETPTNYGVIAGDDTASAISNYLRNTRFNYGFRAATPTISEAPAVGPFVLQGGCMNRISRSPIAPFFRTGDSSIGELICDKRKIRRRAAGKM